MKKVSEIIAGALEIFGKDGEHWNNHALASVKYHDGKKIDTYCALGGLSKAAYGSVAYPRKENNYKKAAELVLAHTPKYYQDTSILNWNDSRPSGKRGFNQIKKAFCAALKTALEQEKPVKKARKVARKSTKRSRR